MLVLVADDDQPTRPLPVEVVAELGVRVAVRVWASSAADTRSRDQPGARSERDRDRRRSLAVGQSIAGGG